MATNWTATSAPALIILRQSAENVAERALFSASLTLGTAIVLLSGIAHRAPSKPRRCGNGPPDRRAVRARPPAAGARVRGDGVPAPTTVNRVSRATFDAGGRTGVSRVFLARAGAPDPRSLGFCVRLRLGDYSTPQSIARAASGYSKRGLTPLLGGYPPRIPATSTVVRRRPPRAFSGAFLSNLCDQPDGCRVRVVGHRPVLNNRRARSEGQPFGR